MQWGGIAKTFMTIVHFVIKAPYLVCIIINANLDIGAPPI